MAIFDETLEDTLTAGQVDAQTLTYNVVAADGPRISAMLEGTKATNVVSAEGLNLGSSLAAFYGLVMVERVRLSQTHVPNHYFNFTMAEAATLREALLRSFPTDMAESMTIAAAQIATQATTVIEELEIADAIAPTLLYTKTISEQVSVAATIARFLGAEAVDGFNIAEALISVGMGAQLVAEGVTIADAATPLFMLRVTMAEGVEIDAEELVNAIYSGNIAEGIEVAGAYLSPGDGVTTWVMNTRTAAVTEYDNFAFNSFARMGVKYIGASDAGLYELLGDGDDGTDVIATIKSGLAQWGGTHLGSIKAAYLATRGGGDFVLRIFSGDGKTYNYSVTANAARTTRVNIGKGLRARYFAFELISTGQDFDLDMLEFIPLIAQRRV